MGAVHNELRRAVDVQNAFAHALGESTDFAGLERGGETLTPIMNLWDLPEWAYLRAEELRWRRVGVAAGGAGNFSEVQVLNPAGSGIIAVVDVRPDTNAVYVTLEDTTAVLATNDVGLWPRDGRLKKPGSVIRLRSGNASAVVVTSIGWTLAANETLAGRIVLTPGRLVRCQGTAANLALGVSVAVRMRRALDSELE